MTTHSPGPWHDDGPNIYDANGNLVALVAWSRASGHENATLIAAAPDLAEALREALEYENEDTQCFLAGREDEGPSFEECPDHRCADHGCMVARINRWRAALAKAREEQ